MIRTTIYSNEKKTFEMVEREDERVFKLHSIWEALHFIGVGIALWRWSREQEGSAEERVGSEGGGKPLYVKWRSFKLRLG